ncbi:hypothetical protein Tco_1011406, partial [Tanacetum coccineum]
MAQSQRQGDVDLDNPLCLNESKILANILYNHPLRFSIAASTSVPWIYLGQIFQLAHATENNHERFVLLPRKHKAGVGMKIPNWMITDEMTLTKNYRMTPGTPRTPNPEVSKGESAAQQKKVIIVKEHLAAEEIKKMVEGTENVDVDEFVNSILNSQNDPGTRLDPGSYMESLEVEITVVIQPVNVIEEKDESTEDDYELRRRELTVTDPKLTSSTPSSSSSTLSTSQRLLSLFKSKTRHSKQYRSFFVELKGRYRYLFGHLKTAFMPRKRFVELATHLQEIMQDSLPFMVDSHVNEAAKTTVPVYVAKGLLMEKPGMQAEVAQMVADAIQRERENLQAEFTSQINNVITNQIPSRVDSLVRHELKMQRDDLPIWLALKIKFEGLIANNTPCRSSAIHPRDQDDHHDDAPPEGEKSAKRQKISKHGTYVFGESSSGKADKSNPSPSTSGDEHQYHIDQMQNFLKNDIVWESRKEILSSPYPQKPTPVVQSSQRDPKVPALSLVNQDLLYLKKGNSRSRKYVLSLHKFPTVIFSDDDIEEITSRW